MASSSRCFISTLILVLCLVTVSYSSDSNNAEAEAALALAKSKKCVCHDDLEECKKESTKTGKPLVLSVNTKCEGFSSKLDWAIFCKVKTFDNDDKARFVILSPDKKGGELVVRKTIQVDTKISEFEKQLKLCVKAYKPLDWV